MKHDLESESHQNDCIVDLASLVAGLSAHVGFAPGVKGAHRIVASFADAPEAEPEEPKPEPKAVLMVDPPAEPAPPDPTPEEIALRVPADVPDGYVLPDGSVSKSQAKRLAAQGKGGK